MHTPIHKEIKEHFDAKKMGGEAAHLLFTTLALSFLCELVCAFPRGIPVELFLKFSAGFRDDFFVIFS